MWVKKKITVKKTNNLSISYCISSNLQIWARCASIFTHFIKFRISILYFVPILMQEISFLLLCLWAVFCVHPLENQRFSLFCFEAEGKSLCYPHSLLFFLMQFRWLLSCVDNRTKRWTVWSKKLIMLDTTFRTLTWCEISKILAAVSSRRSRKTWVLLFCIQLMKSSCLNILPTISIDIFYSGLFCLQDFNPRLLQGKNFANKFISTF